MTGDKRRILLMVAGGIGDFINAAPAIQALRAGHPDAFLGLLVTDRCYDYAARCPHVDRVYALPSLHHGRTWRERLATQAETVAALWRLRRERFEVLVNLMSIGSLRGALRVWTMIRLLGVSLSVGRDTAGRGSFYDLRLAEPSTEGDESSDAERFLALASLLGRPLTLPKSPEIWINEEERGQARDLLRELDGPGPLVLIHPGSDRETRLWFAERYAEFAAELVGARKARVAVVGGAQEAALAAQIQRLARPALVRTLCGRTTIGSLACLFGAADLVVCNYSMALHLAAAVAAPCLGLCASGYPQRDRPLWAHGQMLLLWKPLSCSPCYHWHCPQKAYMRCMEQISVEDALRGADALLAGKP